MTALYPWRIPEDHPAVPFVRPGEIAYSRTRKTRIYRFDGTWWSIQPDPSGGEIRTRYPDGRAAMVALDGRNREKAPLPPTMTGFLAALQELNHDMASFGIRDIRHLPGQCPPSTPTTKDCE
ncbi:hypothetical protein [Brachybacterium subflavum]|uniref:hypothetical protein n=1 Tax=Brachybacterium subflavum TaxID=2585206 RepID=UPI0012662B9B|nr:hypothetical protein [Brachybacterium subflavum]